MAQRDLQIRITVNSAQAKASIDALVAQMNKVSGAQAKVTAATTKAEKVDKQSAFTTQEKTSRQKSNTRAIRENVTAINASNSAQGARARLEQAAVRSLATQRQRALDLSGAQGRLTAARLKAARASQQQFAAAQRLNAQLAKQHAAMKRLRMDYHSKQMSEFQSATDRARRTAYSMTIAGGQMAMVGKRITAAFMEVGKTFAEFDFKVRRAAGAMEIFGGPLLKKLQGSIEDLAIEAKLFTGSEVAEGLYFWGSATGEVIKSQEDLLRVQKNILPIMKAAAMTEIGLETATKGVVSVLQQFNLEMSMSEKVTHDMFLVAQKTAVEFVDLIETFKMMGPTAAQFNVGYEEMVRLAGAIGNAGIRGTRMGRAMRMVFTRMVKEPAKATKQINALSQAINGVNWDDVQFTAKGDFIGFEEYVDEFYKIVKNLSMEDTATLINQMFPRATAPVFLQIMEMNRRSIEEFGQGLFAAEGAMVDLTRSTEVFDEAWRLLGESAKGTLNEFANRVAPLMHDIGQAVIDVIAPFLDLIGGIAEATSAFLRANPIIAKFIAGIGLLTGAFLTLVGAGLLVTGFMWLLTRAVLPNLMINFAKTVLHAKMMDMSLLSIRNSGGVAKGSIDALRVSLKGLRQAAAGGFSNIIDVGVGRKNAGLAKQATGPTIIPPVVRRGTPKNIAGQSKAVTAAQIGIQARLAAVLKTVGKGWAFMSKNAGKFLKLGSKITIIVAVVVTVFEVFTKALKKVTGGGDSASNMMEMLGGVLNMLLAPLRWAWEGVKLFLDVLDWLAERLSGPLAVAMVRLGTILDALGGVFAAVGDWINDKFGGVIEHMSNLLSGIAQVIGMASDAWDDFWEKGLEDAKGTDKYLSDIAANQQRLADEATRAKQAAAANAALDDMEMIDLEATVNAASAAASGAVAEIKTVFVKSSGEIREAADRGLADPIRKALSASLNTDNIENMVTTFSSNLSDLSNASVESDSTDRWVQYGNDASDYIYAGLHNGLRAAIQNKGLLPGAEVIETFYDAARHANLASSDRDALVIEMSQQWSKSFGDIGKKAGSQMVVGALRFIKNGLENAPKTFTWLADQALKNIRSKNPKWRALGYEQAKVLKRGLATGNTQIVIPYLKQMSDKAAVMIESSNPKVRKAGFKQMRTLANAILDGGEDVWDAEWHVAKLALQYLNSGAPGAATVGANMMAYMTNGLWESSPAVYEAAKAIAQNAVDVMNAAIDAINRTMSAIPGSIKIPHREVTDADIVAALPKVEKVELHLPKRTTGPRAGYKTPTADSPSGGGGGGGGGGGAGGGGGKGGGGDEQSPLEKALEVASNAAALVEALRQVEGYNLKAMVRRSMGGLAEAMKMAMKITYKETKGFSKKKLQKVANFSESISALTGALSTVIEAFKEIPNFNGAKWGEIKAVVDGAKMVINIMYKAGKSIKTKKHVVARTFAETAGAVVGALSATIQAFREVQKNGYQSVSSQAMEAIITDITKAMTLMVSAAKGFDRMSTDIAAQFAESVSPVMSAIGDTITAFKELKDYVSPLPGLMDQVMADLKSTMARFIRQADEFGLSTEEWNIIGAFADTVSGVMGALSATWEAHNKTIEFVDQFRTSIDPAVLFAQMRSSMEEMKIIAGMYTPDEIEKIKNTADAASAIASAIEGFYAIGKNASQDPDTLGRMALDAINAIMGTMSEFVASYHQYGYDLVANFHSGLQAGQAEFGMLTLLQDNNTITIEHTVSDPNGVLLNASAQDVADLLNGQEFITNLQGAVANQ